MEDFQAKGFNKKHGSDKTLGAAKILCVDKTGTLTLNKMRLDMLSVEE